MEETSASPGRRGNPVMRCKAVECPHEQPGECPSLVQHGGPGDRDHEDGNGDPHKVECRTLALGDDHAGRGEQSEPEGREHERRQQRPGGESFRSSEAAKLPEAERTRDERPRRQRARDGAGGEGDRREPPQAGANTAATKQALIHAGESHQRQRLDSYRDQQPSRVEMGELARPRPPARHLDRSPPTGRCHRADPDDEADARPSPLAPSRPVRRPGRQPAHNSSGLV